MQPEAQTAIRDLTGPQVERLHPLPSEVERAIRGGIGLTIEDEEQLPRSKEEDRRKKQKTDKPRDLFGEHLRSMGDIDAAADIAVPAGEDDLDLDLVRHEKKFGHV